MKKTRIKTITKLPPSENFVYDISVKSDDESQHLFFGNGILCHNTDSVSADTLVRTNAGIQEIEALFDQSRIKWSDGDKEYAADDRLGVLSLVDDEAKLGAFDYVYRHKTKKKKYRITDSSGKSVVVTEDHSVMVLDDNGNLVEKKPAEIAVGDKVLTV